MKRNLSILGATGSIGTQTLQVVDNNKDALNVVSLTAGDNTGLLSEQIVIYEPKVVSVKSEEGALRLKEKLSAMKQTQDFKMPEILYGMEGFIHCATLPEADMVVAAMVGMIGLRPVIEAIKSGKDIALANKETLVTAGHLIMPLVKEYGVSLLPVDSEHSAIFQCLQSGGHDEIEEIFLTASGGPFRHYSAKEVEHVTVEQALAHPNWFMGNKITIDSATMINKGLEIIEACWLFGVGLDRVHVLVQPNSIIHSMVGFRDGAVMAQLGSPDMRLPIQYALMYPARPALDGERLDFEKLASISFERPNTEVLRGIELAKRSFETGGSMTTVMNAANEYAVSRFLKKEIRFTDIYSMIEYAMDRHVFIKKPSLDDILETEQETYSVLEKYKI
ncbi:MAG: 1-deoxy-D-xylulose-5-phosphate reductoisomerase [Roseburia sp.]|nr:1-deoxy-D-xylulose-5-phosphate reductoisomerase [Roseburia sp.]